MLPPGVFVFLQLDYHIKLEHRENRCLLRILSMEKSGDIGEYLLHPGELIFEVHSTLKPMRHLAKMHEVSLLRFLGPRSDSVQSLHKWRVAVVVGTV